MSRSGFGDRGFRWRILRRFGGWGFGGWGIGLGCCCCFGWIQVDVGLCLGRRVRCCRDICLEGGGLDGFWLAKVPWEVYMYYMWRNR